MIIIKALGYVGIAAKDPQAWRSFMTNVVGLMAVEEQCTPDKLYFRMDAYRWRVCVFKSDYDALDYAGWEVADKQAFDQTLQSLNNQGVSYTRLNDQQCREKMIREAIRFSDPAGNTLELFYNMKLDYQRLNTPANVPAFETGYHGDMGLGHFVLPTSHFAECHQFYTQILGFGETDYMHFHFSEQANDPGQGLHFLHVNNPRHHSLAIYQDPNPPSHNCVHLMFEVKNMDEVGYFIDRCKQHDVPIVSSLGRHTNDLMLSVYVASPAGFAIEFGCEGVQLDWDNYTPTESLTPSLWGHDWKH